jgi:hypothetical protein
MNLVADGSHHLDDLSSGSSSGQFVAHYARHDRALITAAHREQGSTRPPRVLA